MSPTHHEIPVVAPKRPLRLERVSARLKGELVHRNRSAALVGARFAPDGQRLIAGDYPGGVVVVWDVATGKERTVIETGYEFRATYQYFFVTPDWQTLLVSHAQSSHEWVEQHGKRLIRWTFDGKVRAWDLETGQLRRTYQQKPPHNVRQMELSPDGSRLVTLDVLPGTYDLLGKTAIGLWDRTTGRQRLLMTDPGAVGRFTPDGRTVVIPAMDAERYTRALRLFDTASGREQQSIAVPDKRAWIDLGDFSPDSRLVAGNYQVDERPGRRDGARLWLKCWDLGTGREVLSWAAPKDDFFTCRFAPDGRTLAAVHRPDTKLELLLFRVPDGRLLQTVPLGGKVPGERRITSPPVFSPDGRWLALTTQVFPQNPGRDEDALDVPQPRILLIDVAAGAVRETLVSPQGFAHGSCCFSPDGRTLATGGYGRILLWDVGDLRPLPSPVNRKPTTPPPARLRPAAASR